MNPESASRSDVILAAGGILWRDSARGPEIAVVHRPKYDDWTLPKGKLDAGERWQEAALREVEEETGMRAQIESFAGGCTYLTRLRPKVVLYWNMRILGPYRFAPRDRSEVDALEWLSPAEARARLTYEREQRLLSEGPSGP